MIEYDQDVSNETKIESIQQCQESKNSQSITWIEVYGLYDISIIEEIGKLFEIHPLELE